MLQFIAEDNDRYSIPEQIQMAIEGGCSWVQLRPHGMSDAEIRELASEIVPLCKETETILTIEDHLELARELGIHGVQLTGSDISPRDAREMLGPEAIIGVDVTAADGVMTLPGLDIDYATFRPMPVDRLKENIAKVRAAGIDIPVVASGGIMLDNINEYLAAGCSGVAVGKAIADADDPVEATRQFLQILY